jgi:hypothetical protein
VRDQIPDLFESRTPGALMAGEVLDDHGPAAVVDMN